MQPEAFATGEQESARGLPTVVPPTGKFIAQLFLVPFLIVTSVVCFLLFVNWLVGSARGPADFLKKLDSPNDDVRWRAAEDLAQVLIRDDALASDPKFCLDLTERLDQAARDQDHNQENDNDVGRATALRGRAPADSPLQGEGDYVLYLSACLGNVAIPVAAPLLSRMAVKREGADPATIARRRWRALWVLANLGENLKRFDRLPDETRETFLQSLREEAAAAGSRGEWARTALNYLQGPDAKSLKPLGVEDALTQCAEDPDPFLRTMAAFALNFWEGTDSENEHFEQVLVKLASDNGHGEESLARMREAEGRAEETITAVPGLKVRYNATVALARKGSAKTRLDVLAEMLDEDKQRENFRLKRDDGQEVADESTISITLVTALKAIVELRRRSPGRDLSSLAPALEKLAQNPNMALRSEATRTRFALAE